MQTEIREKFADFLRQQLGLIDQTIQSYFVELDKLESIYGDELHKIPDNETASRLIIKRRKVGYNGEELSGTTAAKIASHLKCFFDFCVSYKLMPAPHPFWAGHRFKKDPIKEPDFLDANDPDDRNTIKRVLFYPDMDITHRAMLWTIYATGVRRGELIGLELNDLDLAERTIHVRRQIAKFKKFRYVPFDQQAADILAQYREAIMLRWPNKCNEPGFRLFPNRMGEPMHPKSFNRFLLRLQHRLELNQPINPKVWRHSYPVRMLLGDVELPIISKLMGHARLSTTGTYIHYRKSTMRNAIDKAQLIAV